MARMIIPKRLPLNIVGSNKFGRYPKISSESTYNMFESDGWLVPTPGYLKVGTISDRGDGRGIFTSSRGGFMIIVIDNAVYKVTKEIKKFGREIKIGDPSEKAWQAVGNIDTFIGDVFIDENLAEEIAICDQQKLYIYNYRTNTFTKVTLDFVPLYVIYHDTRFLAPDANKPEWRLSEPNDGTTWNYSASTVGEFETKADNPRAVIRVPGKGNQVFVIGSIITESWSDVGYKLFPYYKTTSVSIDYGTISQSTIAASDNFVVWLAKNEKASPVILVSTGGVPRPISTDGIDLALSQLTAPEDSYGFIYKNDGHLFYQLTFDTDNVSYLYDFNTNKFYFTTDENLNRNIIKRVAFFENDYYFISLIDGNLYRLEGTRTTYDGEVIQRIRIANTLRLVDSSIFVANKMGFTLEQGNEKDLQAIDVSLSYDGGEIFGNSYRYDLNSLGQRQNQFTVRDMGRANSITPQFRFWGNGRFVCTNGYFEYYK